MKRAGTPREVRYVARHAFVHIGKLVHRMKCLEFLYFYLLDETPAPTSTSPIQIPTAPVTPVRKKPYLSPKPMFPWSRQASSASLTTSRSASDESLTSMTSASTAPSSVASSPDNTSMLSIDVSVASSSPATSPLSHNYCAPIGSPPLRNRSRSGCGNSPSPLKRRQIGSSPRHQPSKSLSSIPSIKITPSVSKPGNKPLNKCWSEELPGTYNRKEDALRGLASEPIKSAEEKKELLGTMLGNVDALVDSVRKAGIWGLS